MNKYRAFAKDTIVFAIGNFGSKILSFLFVSLYTSYLSTAQYGTADIIITTIALLLPVLTIGMAEGVLRFLHDKEINHNDIYSIGMASIITANLFGIIIFTICSFFIKVVSDYYFFFIMLLFLTAIEELFANFVKGIGKTKVFAIKGIVYTFAFILSNIIFLAVLNYGIEGYLISYLIAYFSSICVMFILAKLYKYKFDIKIKKELLKNMLIYSMAFVPGAIAWWINSSADKYVLVFFLGPNSNGIYSVAQKIPTLITAVTTIITQSWQLSAMRNYGEKEFDNFFSEVFNILSKILLIGASFVLVLNRHIAFLIFKKEFFVAWKFVPMLTTAAIFSTLSGFLASAFTSSKKTKFLLISTLTSALINIILNVVLVNIIGEFGVAIATSLSFGVLVLIRIISLKKIVVLNTNYLKLIFSVIVLFVCSSLVNYLEERYYYYVAFAGIVIILVLNLKDMFSLLLSMTKKMKREYNVDNHDSV